MPVPDGSRPAAIEISSELGIPYREGLVKNRYVGRTFLMPDQRIRELSVRRKLNAMESVLKDKNILLIDDSIVRGTTLRDSILKIVARLRPKKIVIVSSAPQIRFPDCYGIDMSRMKDFVAFRALVALLEEKNKSHLLQETYERCKAQEKLPPEQMKNEVIALYETFSYEEISKKIAEIVKPEGIKPKVEVIYQTIKGLHQACPNNKGDWYFSGIYPTPGGNRVANRAFITYMENCDKRAY